MNSNEARRPGRPARSFSIGELEQKVAELRRELERLSAELLEGRSTLPRTTEREILRVARALNKENRILQGRLADEQTERMF